MLLLTNQDVERVLDMKSCLESLEVGYNDLVNKTATYRPRTGMVVTGATFEQFTDPHYHFAVMEGASRTLGVCAIRIRSDIYAFQEGRHIQFSVKPGLYCGLILLFSVHNGEPLAIIQDGILQHMRLGGTAGLGAKYLARPESSQVGIIGSGGHARTYLWAFSLLFNLKKAKVFSPTKINREKYAAEMTEKLGIPVESVETPMEAMRNADIVASCTDAYEPVIDDPSWIEDGMHLTDNSAAEWGSRALDRCDVKVRLGYANLQTHEPGTTRVGQEYLYVAGQAEELKKLPAGRPNLPPGVDYWPVFTDLLAGNIEGRTGNNEVTFFNNHGSQGLQFAAVGAKVYELAQEAGLGKQIPSEWFLEDIRD